MLDKTCCGGYHFLATKRRRYSASSIASPTRKTRSIGWWTASIASSARSCCAHPGKKPDLILSTYPFTTEMVSKLKERGKIDIPLICLMTDYGPHRTWIAKGVDAYVVANEEMVPRMEALGVAKEQIYPFGIPVNGVFSPRPTRKSC